MQCIVSGCKADLTASIILRRIAVPVLLGLIIGAACFGAIHYSHAASPYWMSAFLVVPALAAFAILSVVLMPGLWKETRSVILMRNG